MAASHYHLVTRWVVDGTPEEVASVFSDSAALSRWFPATYLESTVLHPGMPGHEVGKVVRVRVKGWMPHTLSFVFRVVAADTPLTFTVEATGDFEGRLECRSSRLPSGTAVDFDWQIRVTKPFVRRFSWLLRPLFISNHLWVVARGEQSLNIELRRRRAEAVGHPFGERPPGPMFPHGPLSNCLDRRTWSTARLLQRP